MQTLQGVYKCNTQKWGTETYTLSFQTYENSHIYFWPQFSGITKKKKKISWLQCHEMSGLFVFKTTNIYQLFSRHFHLLESSGVWWSSSWIKTPDFVPAVSRSRWGFHCMTSSNFFLFLENKNSHVLDMYGNTQTCTNTVGCERAD